MTECPCCSGRSFDECCGPILAKEKKAQTAEELLRARYTAHVKVEMEFVQASVHPDSQDDYDMDVAKDWAEKSEWKGLEVLKVEGGGADDEKGTIELVANYVQDKKEHRHHELANFVKIDDEWFFDDATFVKPKPVIRELPKVGRNDPCLCGSGRKFKKCCRNEETLAAKLEAQASA